jgi:membrane protease YdiL (CAAX protease family)
MNSTIQQAPLRNFWLFTFAISWGLSAYLLFVTSPDALENITPQFIIVAFICGLSPTITAFVISAIQGDTKKLTQQIKPAGMFRYCIPLLLFVPVLTFTSSLLTHPFEIRVKTPDIILGLVWPLFASFGEEFGWRGFALPRLLQKKGFVYASITIGLIWGLWHLPMDLIGLRSHGWWFIPEFLLLGPGILTAHSIIMSFIYVSSNTNLLLMIIYHYTITASAILVPSLFTAPDTTPGITLLFQPLVDNIIFWIPATFILLKQRRIESDAVLETQHT